MLKKTLQTFVHLRKINFIQLLVFMHGFWDAHEIWFELANSFNIILTEITGCPVPTKISTSCLVGSIWEGRSGTPYRNYLEPCNKSSIGNNG